MVPAWWISHLALDWKNKAFKRFFQQLGQYFTVIRYDRPGAGLSGRERDGFTLEDEVTTLNDLIVHLKLDSCSLLGVSCGGPPSIVYAHRNPDKVKKIVFLGAYCDGADIGQSTIQQALCSFVEASWGLGAKAILDLFDPEMDSDLRRETGKIHRESANPKMASALLQLSFDMDASEAASQLTIPALVIHRTKDHTIPFNAGRKLASILPNAQLISMAGSAHIPWMGKEADEIVAEIINFISDSTDSVSPVIQEPNQFRQTGDIWTISFAGKTIHLKDARGLHDIALLIKQSGKELHVGDMVDSGYLVASSSESTVIDQQAINQYKQRLLDIIEQKPAAAEAGDESAYKNLEQEEEAILQSLSQSMGLNGAARAFNNPTEKARKAVAARLRTALKKIVSAHPDLGDHLEMALKTGNFCSYSPDSTTQWNT